MADTSSSLATVTFNAIKAMTDPLFERIKALEADVATLKAQAPAALDRRVSDLEGRTSLHYRGVYTPGHYHEGDVVTWSGSMWVARRSGPLATPGNDPSAWTLAVKRGKDAR